MTVLDTKLLPVVFNIIEKYGKTVSFGVQTGGVYDEGTRTYSGGTTTPTSKKVSPPDRFADELINGDTIQAKDLYVILPAQGLTFTPQVGWTVTVDSVVYMTIRVDPIYSGELVAAYQIQLRA